MAKEEKKQSYVLVILRRDGEHITVSENESYDKTFELYNELIAKWTAAVKEHVPFSINSPVVTTFDPGLIYEITIKPIVETMSSGRYDNPYQQAMRKQGFQNTFGNQDMLSEIKDGGYR